MKGLKPIFKREVLAYFRSPVAFVFIIIFLIASAGCTFLLGNFYESTQASLEIFRDMTLLARAAELRSVSPSGTMGTR